MEKLTVEYFGHLVAVRNGIHLILFEGTFNLCILYMLEKSLELC